MHTYADGGEFTMVVGGAVHTLREGDVIHVPRGVVHGFGVKGAASILAISTPEMMGGYYLFSVYFTFVVFLIALSSIMSFAMTFSGMPRLIGIRCGVKLTRMGLPAASLNPCSISGAWRWLAMP